MTYTKRITITESLHGQRIDSIAQTIIPHISRNQWKKNGEFFLNNEKKDPKTKTKRTEIWDIVYKEPPIEHLIPWNHPLVILQESESWIAIEKPHGISVHPSVSDPSPHTIVNALIHQWTSLSEVGGIERPGIVHRLDKGTSGVLLVAKTNKTHRFLQEHWGEVIKIYHAHTNGVPPLKGKIESGIQRSHQNRQKMKASDDPTAKQAITHFERLSTQKNRSHLRIQIPTGRTHQIRVHLSEIGFPIVGDEKYGGEPFERMMLHAYSISFPDPDKKGATTTVIAPLPHMFTSV